jgi:hypothetical protein
MRSILIIFSLAFSMTGFSQDTLATVVNHDWAAGQCCSSGTDITLTLSEKLTSWDFDSLVYISSHSSRVVLYPTDFYEQGFHPENKCIVSYGWNTSSHGRHTLGSSTVCYGLPENRFTIVSNQQAHLLIYKKNEMKRAFVKEHFTITAYP